MLFSLTQEKVMPKFTPLLVPAMLLTSIGGGLLPRKRFRTLSITGALLCFTTLVFKYPTGEKAQDYFLPIQATVILTRWVDFYVLHNPEKKISRLRDRGVRPTTWRGKLGWVWDLNTTFRGLGWNWKVKNVPIGVPQSKPYYA